MPQNTIQSKPKKNLKPYTPEFYKKRRLWRRDYEAIADWLVGNTQGRSFGDAGCGNGYMLARLHTAGKQVWGIDLTDTYVDASIRPFVKNSDLSKPHAFTKTDVILCFDVADRIEEKNADTVVKNLVSAEPSTVFFTASLPGKAGIYHVNLQSREYWATKFGGHDYYLDAALTHKFKTDLAKKITGPVWYLEDIMIFKKYTKSDVIGAGVAASKAMEDLAAEVGYLKGKNKKLLDDLWIVNQRLNSIVNSARWKASSKLIRLIKK